MEFATPEKPRARSMVPMDALAEIRDGRARCASCGQPATRVIGGPAPQAYCGGPACRDSLNLDKQIERLKADRARADLPKEVVR